MYTNFVRHVYIVTDRQVPDWLRKNKKVTVVDHKEIFPDLNDLPTFNSHAIEACLHRIPGLSSRFLYMNDDFLFARATTIYKFFTSNWYPRLHNSNYTFIPPGKPTAEDLPVDAAAKNARDFFLE